MHFKYLYLCIKFYIIYKTIYIQSISIKFLYLFTEPQINETVITMNIVKNSLRNCYTLLYIWYSYQFALFCMQFFIIKFFGAPPPKKNHAYFQHLPCVTRP